MLGGVEKGAENGKMCPLPPSPPQSPVERPGERVKGSGVVQRK